MKKNKRLLKEASPQSIEFCWSITNSSSCSKTQLSDSSSIVAIRELKEPLYFLKPNKSNVKSQFHIKETKDKKGMHLDISSIERNFNVDADNWEVSGAQKRMSKGRNKNARRALKLQLRPKVLATSINLSSSLDVSGLVVNSGITESRFSDQLCAKSLSRLSHCANVSPLVSDSAVYECTTGGRKSFICVSLADDTNSCVQSKISDSVAEEISSRQLRLRTQNSKTQTCLRKRTLSKTVSRYEKMAKKICLVRDIDTLNSSKKSSLSSINNSNINTLNSEKSLNIDESLPNVFSQKRDKYKSNNSNANVFASKNSNIDINDSKNSNIGTNESKKSIIDANVPKNSNINETPHISESNIILEDEGLENYEPPYISIIHDEGSTINSSSSQPLDKSKHKITEHTHNEDASDKSQIISTHGIRRNGTKEGGNAGNITCILPITDSYNEDAIVNEQLIDSNSSQEKSAIVFDLYPVDDNKENAIASNIYSKTFSENGVKRFTSKIPTLRKNATKSTRKSLSLIEFTKSSIFINLDHSDDIIDVELLPKSDIERDDSKVMKNVSSRYNLRTNKEISSNFEGRKDCRGSEEFIHTSVVENSIDVSNSNISIRRIDMSISRSAPSLVTASLYSNDDESLTEVADINSRYNLGKPGPNSEEENNNVTAEKCMPESTPLSAYLRNTDEMEEIKCPRTVSRYNLRKNKNIIPLDCEQINSTEENLGLRNVESLNGKNISMLLVPSLNSERNKLEWPKPLVSYSSSTPSVINSSMLRHDRITENNEPDSSFAVDTTLSSKIIEGSTIYSRPYSSNNNQIVEENNESLIELPSIGNLLLLKSRATNDTAPVRVYNLRNNKGNHVSTSHSVNTVIPRPDSLYLNTEHSHQSSMDHVVIKEMDSIRDSFTTTKCAMLPHNVDIPCPDSMHRVVDGASSVTTDVTTISTEARPSTSHNTSTTVTNIKKKEVARIYNLRHNNKSNFAVKVNTDLVPVSVDMPVAKVVVKDIYSIKDSPETTERPVSPNNIVNLESECYKFEDIDSESPITTHVSDTSPKTMIIPSTSAIQSSHLQHSYKISTIVEPQQTCESLHESDRSYCQLSTIERSYLESTRIMAADHLNQLNIQLSPIVKNVSEIIQQNTEDISDCTSSDDDLYEEDEYEQESSICASPSVAKIRPNFYDKLTDIRKNEVIEEETEENGSDVELKGSLPQAQSIHKDIAKSSFPVDLDETDLGHGYNKLDSATRSSSRQLASHSLINYSKKIRSSYKKQKERSKRNILSNNDVSNSIMVPSTVRRNKNNIFIESSDENSSVEEEESFHEGFTTFLKDKKANAPTRSTVLSKMKHDLSFVNPSDGKCTQQGIIRIKNKRTRAQTHGIYDRVIYTYSAKDKAHVISHREVAVSPRTVRRRRAIKNVTENLSTNIHRKYNVSMLRQFAKPDYMDLSKYSQSRDGESVTIIDPDTQMVLVKKVIISEDEYKEGYGDFVEKHRYRLRPKYFSKRLLNSECETVLEVRSPSTRAITVLVVIDECSIQLRSPQRLVVPRDVWHFFYNDNTVTVTVTTHGRDQNQSSS